MDISQKRKTRDIIKVIIALFLFVVYIPHVVLYLLSKNKDLIDSDLDVLKQQVNIKLKNGLALLFFLHNNSYYRSLFYYRIGPIAASIIGWWRPRNRFFILPDSTSIGQGLYFVHPYSTILNAESIGSNFKCIHCTTIGKKDGKRPIIGNNVEVGCHVCIIGDIRIGNNVTIGAGSVVINSIPDNAVVAGNPAHIIKFKNEGSHTDK